jgi:hypothetical protein
MLWRPFTFQVDEMLLIVPRTAHGLERVDAGEEENDEMCIRVAIQALKGVSADRLPLSLSEFHSKFMHDIMQVDMKRTRFKKISKLVSFLEKQGVMATKAIRSIDHITLIDQNHTLYFQSFSFLRAKGR